jgi:ABC-type cobalamin/Fe3+-siderophores transport system ATPase subunit
MGHIPHQSTPPSTPWVSSRVVWIKDGQVLADSRPDEQISPEDLKKRYHVCMCVCVAHSETGVSAFVPTGLRTWSAKVPSTSSP